MATGTAIADDQDQGWQDYKPPQKPAAQTAGGDTDWQDYAPTTVPAKPATLPAKKYTKEEIAAGAATPETKFEKERAPEREPFARQANEFNLGYASSLSGLPESTTPVSDVMKQGPPSLGETLKDPGSYLGPGYSLAKGLYGIGKEIVSPSDTWKNPQTGREESVQLSPEDEAARRAHGVGSAVGTAQAFALGPETEELGAAKPVRTARGMVGDVLRDKATGEMKPGARHVSQAAGLLAGGAYGAAQANPYEALIGAGAGARAAPDIIGTMFPESEGRIAARTQAEAYEQKAQDLMRRGKEQRALEQQAAKDELLRQKVVRQEEIGQKRALGSTVVGKEPIGPEPMSEEPGPTQKIEEGPKAGEHEAVRAAQKEVARKNARQVVPIGESPNRGAGEEGPIGEEITPGGKVLKPTAATGAGETVKEIARTGNEGRAATWKNEQLYNIIKDPEIPYDTKRLAVAQMVLRQLPLPENARYLMGDPDAARAVYNPKEVTRFTPEGTPIRETSTPEPSSRSLIWQPGETPPPAGPAPDAGRIRTESTRKVPKGTPTERTPETIGKRIETPPKGGTPAAPKPAEAAPEAPREIKAGEIPWDVKETARTAGAEPLGYQPGLEPGKGAWRFVNPANGGGVSVPEGKLTVSALKEAMQKQGEAIKNTPAEGKSDLAEKKGAAARKRNGLDVAAQAKGPEAPPTVPEGKVQDVLSEEERTRAEGRLREEVGMLQSGDRPGVYFDEWEKGNAPKKQSQNIKEGERAGGKWRGVRSGRPMMPFLSEHPEFTPSTLAKALEKDGDNPTYQKAVRAAAEFNRAHPMPGSVGEPIEDPLERAEREAIQGENAPAPETIGERLPEPKGKKKPPKVNF